MDRIIKDLNAISLSLMNDNKNDESLKLLKKCELWTRKIVTQTSDGRISTLNHLACCMRKIGDPKNALKYLENAYQLIKNTNSSISIGSTCLNLSSVFSQINKHNQAIKYAKEAASELSHSIISLQHENFNSQKEYKKEYERRIKMLAIANYNIGIQEEYFER